MPELLLAHVKVSAVDDLLVAELPMRACVDAVPAFDAASNRLGRPIEGWTRREVAFVAELHHPWAMQPFSPASIGWRPARAGSLEVGGRSLVRRRSSKRRASLAARLRFDVPDLARLEKIREVRNNCAQAVVSLWWSF